MPEEKFDGPAKKILIAAEKVFANYGYDGATLRQITNEAGVNLAAVNYYFEDKESLYLAVINRRLQPLNQIRLARLKQAELQAGTQPVPLDSIVEIMAAPIFALWTGANNGGAQAARLLGRTLTEPLPFLDHFLASEFEPVMARFAQAVRRHAATLSPEDFLWRFSFVVGSLHHTLATLHRMKSLTRGICRDHDHEGALRRFVQFAVHAFGTPGR